MNKFDGDISLSNVVIRNQMIALYSLSVYFLRSLYLYVCALFFCLVHRCCCRCYQFVSIEENKKQAKKPTRKSTNADER